MFADFAGARPGVEIAGEDALLGEARRPALSSLICVVRRELESASRWVENTLTRMPLTRIWMRATERE